MAGGMALRAGRLLRSWLLIEIVEDKLEICRLRVRTGNVRLLHFLAAWAINSEQARAARRGERRKSPSDAAAARPIGPKIFALGLRQREVRRALSAGPRSKQRAKVEQFPRRQRLPVAGESSTSFALQMREREGSGEKEKGREEKEKQRAPCQSCLDDLLRLATAFAKTMLRWWRARVFADGLRLLNALFPIILEITAYTLNVGSQSKHCIRMRSASACILTDHET